ncbi:phosphoadenylyl-sulfate reductase [Asticcacaulis sp. YBE204]|uniref:phosphoadenylyl-sulfate reductase n=1 Tax=Asticcacaulis sp. YBE204 TaxID=1282363 RepID=UPI0003C3C510|nr:phosphoadenylyl-sulfate reductase [Asticcacaulis sp. YBE204]ESQ81157.1 phosphoadenosine phosphosulfate reductase [Asticcacaulis sp. YBE204]
MTVLINNLVADTPEHERARMLSAKYEGWNAESILRDAIDHEFVGQIALSSSFGADAVVLLHLVAQIDRTTPVIFLDTDRHFFQTLQYRDELVAQLGLTNLINLRPALEDVRALDPKNVLFQSDPDACCDIRKTKPLAAVTKDYAAWISGRKRGQAATRKAMQIVEFDGRNFKINPLADWSPVDVADYIRAHNLPPHPLVEQGYPSIGCFTCTKPVEEGQDARAGRWAGQDKTECGIHLSVYDGGGI